MTPVQDATEQQRQADLLHQKTEELTNREKNTLREEITSLDRSISDLQAQRNKAAARLSKL